MLSLIETYKLIFCSSCCHVCYIISSRSKRTAVRTSTLFHVVHWRQLMHRRPVFTKSHFNICIPCAYQQKAVANRPW